MSTQLTVSESTTGTSGCAIRTLVASVLLIFCCTGATCIPRKSIPDFQPPVIFQAPPSLNELVEVVNRTQTIQQLQSPAVTIKLSGVPKMKATLDWQRERNFRIKGGVSNFTGTDFDLGSNDAIFWMQSRHEPAIYFAQHAQFDQQMNRQVLPVSPLWIIEALGILSINPDLVTEPPQVGPDGLIRLSTIAPSPVGQYLRTLHIDAQNATVKQIMLRDPSGRLLATAYLTDHQYSSVVNSSLPRKSQVELMPLGGEPITLEIYVAFYRFNEEADISPSLFAAPDASGLQTINLAELNIGAPAVKMPEYAVEPTNVAENAFQGMRR